MTKGYEIHNGVAKKRVKQKKNLYGTFVHGIFDNDKIRKMIFSKIDKSYKGYNFTKFKENSIDEFTKHISKYVDINKIEKTLYE
jgi:adenosylcobyric acid synthase